MGINENNKWTDFYNYITQLGVNYKKHSPKESKKIVLFNIHCIIWYIIGSILIFSHFFRTPIHYPSIVAHALMLIGIIIAQFTHAKLSLNTGRIIYLFCLFLVCIVFSNFLKPGHFTEFYFLFAPGLGLVYFDNKYLTRFVLILSFLGFSLPNIYFKNYPSIELYSPVMMCLFLGIYTMVNYFKKLNEKNEKLLALERDRVLSDKIILEKQEAKLRELNEFKTHFFVNLSHEIRTPITLIKGYASKINFKDSEEENEHKLTIVNNQVNQIESILNSILDLSKLDENKLNLNKTEVSITSFINKHYAEFKDLFNKKNIEFKFINQLENLCINMDASLVSKAISNLLNNALKFTKESGFVTINAFRKEDIFIQVIDNGIGIPEKDITKIFERFYQSKNEITKSQGSGIGLSYTKSILEAHNFSITANSNLSTTTFTIKIPNKYVSNQKQSHTIYSPDVEKVIPKNNPVLNISPSNNETILIVDDHHELRSYLKTILKNYNILEAENGIEALKIIKSNTIDLILTDYMMPEMDGKELVTEIKKIKIKVPIIILTARVDDFAKLDMLRIGVDNYMVKPFNEEELLLSIKNSLKTYKNIVNNLKELTTEEKKELNTIETKFYKDIKKIIDDNLDNFNFGVEDIANYLKISTRTLNRRVKNILGQTAKEIIIQAKIEKARELQLKNSKMTKKEIANAVGINNTSYLFKKLTETYGEHYKLN